MAATACQLAEAAERQRTKTSIWDRFNKLASNQRENSKQQRAARAGQQLLREELDLYVTENVIERSQLPLHLVECKPRTISWTGSRVAREFLMIPSASVPSERLFSKAADVTRKKAQFIETKQGRSDNFPNGEHVKFSYNAT